MSPFTSAPPPAVRRGFAPPEVENNRGGYAPGSAFGPTSGRARTRGVAHLLS